MSDNRKQKSGWHFMLQLLGYVLGFAVLAAVFSLLFPGCLLYIVTAAGFLSLAVGGIIVGRWWDQPDMTGEDRRMAQVAVTIVFVVGPVYSTVRDCLAQHSLRPIGSGVIGISAIVATIYIPFFLSRAISRRRARTSQEETPNG